MTNNKNNSRPVFSTDTGDLRKLKLPVGLTKGVANDISNNASGKVRIKLDKKARRGKTVTLIEGVPPQNADNVCKQLKNLCGCGGTVEEGYILIQGDQKEKAKNHLKLAGYQI